MYICNKCNKEFETPLKKEVTFEDYYGVSNLMTGRTHTTIEYCPYCKDDDVEELVLCESCQEYCKEDELHDTEGMINGGIGYVCEQCMENFDIRG